MFFSAVVFNWGMSIQFWSILPSKYLKTDTFNMFYSKMGPETIIHIAMATVIWSEK